MLVQLYCWDSGSYRALSEQHTLLELAPGGRIGGLVSHGVVGVCKLPSVVFQIKLICGLFCQSLVDIN